MGRVRRGAGAGLNHAAFAADAVPGNLVPKARGVSGTAPAGRVGLTRISGRSSESLFGSPWSMYRLQSRSVVRSRCPGRHGPCSPSRSAVICRGRIRGRCWWCWDASSPDRNPGSRRGCPRCGSGPPRGSSTGVRTDTSLHLHPSRPLLGLVSVDPTCRDTGLAGSWFSRAEALGCRGAAPPTPCSTDVPRCSRTYGEPVAEAWRVCFILPGWVDDRDAVGVDRAEQAQGASAVLQVADEVLASCRARRSSGCGSEPGRRGR